MHSRTPEIRVTLTLPVLTGACQERPTAPPTLPTVVNANSGPSAAEYDTAAQGIPACTI